jgi:hypothetical protein
LNCGFAGMIIGWSCTKFVNHLLIGNSRWPPWPKDNRWHVCYIGLLVSEEKNLKHFFQ